MSSVFCYIKFAAVCSHIAKAVKYHLFTYFVNLGKICLKSHSKYYRMYLPRQENCGKTSERAIEDGGLKMASGIDERRRKNVLKITVTFEKGKIRVILSMKKAASTTTPGSGGARKSLK